MIESVRDRGTFEALRAEGRRARHGPVSVVFVPGAERVRVAFGINRKVGTAVVRNRARRRLRAIMRALSQSGPGLRPGAYLLVVRPEAAQLPYSVLARQVEDACRKVAR